MSTETNRFGRSRFVRSDAEKGAPFETGRLLLQVLLVIAHLIGYSISQSHSFADSSQRTEYIEVEGSLQSLAPVGVNRTTPDSPIAFRCVVDARTGHWRIDDRRVPLRYAFTGGEHIVNTVVATGGILKGLRVSSPDPGDGYPMDADLDQRVIWFVYCATDFHRKNRGQIGLPPFGEPRLDLELHGARMESAWRTAADLCPSNILFRFDQEAFRDAPSKLSVEPLGSYLAERERKYRILQQQTNGSVIASFQVSDWIRLEGVSVPKEWVFEQFFYGRSIRRVVGTTLMARKINALTLPKLPDFAKVTDFRLRDPARGIPYVFYAITNGEIPKVTDPDLGAKAAMAASTSFAVMPPDQRRTRIVFIAIMGIMLLLIPLLRLCTKRREANSK